MPNPFKPRQYGGWETDTVGPSVGAGAPDVVVDELEPFLERLRQLGATPDELADVRAGWDVLDEEWTLEYRHRLSHASDAELAAHLEAIRAEHVAHTMTEEEEALERLLRIGRTALRIAGDLVHDGTVDEALTFLKAAGTEEEYLARAQALEELELAGRRRKGILGVVEPFAGDWRAWLAELEEAVAASLPEE